tara:strand:+ start:609 stop:1511 length:903 start_codon:yes stop_codon:yes gene_type:complete
MRVLITGGSGLVGSHLAELLSSTGYEVRILSRSMAKLSKFKSFFWDPLLEKIDETALHGVDYVIHLSGANIMERRWSNQRKDEIITSRTQSTKLLIKAVKKNNIKLKAFISASATGFYGSQTLEKVFEESDPPHSDFLGESCRLWESSSHELTALNIRKAHLRIGVVLAKKGGALEQMVKPVSLGLGSPFGSGTQYMPWIHIDDLCQIFASVIENSTIEGPYNAVAPESVVNHVFIKKIAERLRKPFWPTRVPAFFLKLLLGEMSTVVLCGSRVSSSKITSTGFRFKYGTLSKALDDLLL